MCYFCMQVNVPKEDSTPYKKFSLPKVSVTEAEIPKCKPFIDQITIPKYSFGIINKNVL